MPTPTAQHSTRSTAVAWLGYLVAIGVNAAIWYGLSAGPGWTVPPFVHSDMSQILGLVNASVVAALVAGLAYLVLDPLWLRALVALVSEAVGLFVLLVIWRVLPVAFGDFAAWPLVARSALVVAIAGSGIAIVGQVVTLLRLAVDSRRGEFPNGWA